MTTNFEPHECVIFVKSSKIGTHENKGIHSIPEYFISAPPVVKRDLYTILGLS